MERHSVKYNREEIVKEVPYKELVDNYDKRMKPDVTRVFQTKFTRPEIDILNKFNQEFRKWYFSKGVPTEFYFRASELALVRRAAAFLKEV